MAPFLPKYTANLYREVKLVQKNKKVKRAGNLGDFLAPLEPNIYEAHHHRPSFKARSSRRVRTVFLLLFLVPKSKLS